MINKTLPELMRELAQPFPADQISWRVGATTKDQTSALGLAYMDARDVMDRLDQACGPDSWQCRYPTVGPITVCEIGILLNDEWIWKADGSGDTDVEGEKGALSGAFKRASVRWGIGRYLYGLDPIWAPIENKRFTADGLDKLNRGYDAYLRKLEWGGDSEGPIVAQIVRFLKASITEFCKTKSDAMEWTAKNEGLLKQLPIVAQKAVNDALRPLMEAE